MVVHGSTVASDTGATRNDFAAEISTPEQTDRTAQEWPIDVTTLDAALLTALRALPQFEKRRLLAVAIDRPLPEYFPDWMVVFTESETGVEFVATRTDHQRILEKRFGRISSGRFDEFWEFTTRTATCSESPALGEFWFAAVNWAGARPVACVVREFDAWFALTSDLTSILYGSGWMTCRAESSMDSIGREFSDARAYCGWQIDDTRRVQDMGRHRVNRHYLVPGDGCVLSLTGYDEGDPDAIDDEIYCHLWVEAPTTRPTDVSFSPQAMVHCGGVHAIGEMDRSVTVSVIVEHRDPGSLRARVILGDQLDETREFRVTEPYMEETRRIDSDRCSDAERTGKEPKQ